MIRPAEPEDFASIMELARVFWSTTDYKDITFDEEYATHMMKLSFDQGLITVLELGGWVVGFVGGFESPILGNKDVSSVIELAYYIKPEHRGNGVELLKGFERQARDRGARFLNMVSLQCSKPEVAEHIYSSMGYEHVESVYRKELS